MAPRAATKSRSTRCSTGIAIQNGYLQQSQRPIVILAFLLPFMALHELGARLFQVEVGASSLMRRAVAMCGIYGRIVPALLCIGTLLLWHLVRRDRWGLAPKTLLVMAAEGFLFALPIFGISFICQHFLPLLTPLSSYGLAAKWSLSFGAGVYEELLFRLYICGGIYLVAAHIFAAKPRTSTIIAVAGSSVLFSLYHYIGPARFDGFTFVFRTLAGAYFAVLFSLRGFGITAGAHAFYDVIVVTLLPV